MKAYVNMIDSKCFIEALFLNIFQRNPMTQMPMFLLLFFNTELLNDKLRFICGVTWPDGMTECTEKR